MTLPYRKKLIEVGLPLVAINAESAREKSIRHGHPSTLHLWWARRPLAACRAVLFSSLVDDPDSDPAYRKADGTVDEDRAGLKRADLFNFIEELVMWENSNNADVIHTARAEIARCVASRLIETGAMKKDAVVGPNTTAYDLVKRGHCKPVSMGLDKKVGRVRFSLDVSNLPPAEVVNAFLAEHAPPVLDPFAGGGSIPLEAQRLGLRAYASDLNPVPVLINKALIEIPPKFAGHPPVNPASRTASAPGVGAEKGKKKQQRLMEHDWPGATGLAEDVRYYGQWMRDEAEKRIGHLYPKVKITQEMVSGSAGLSPGSAGVPPAWDDKSGQDGRAPRLAPRDAPRPDLAPYVGQELTVIAWLWARTIQCPNPGCRTRTPLVRSFWLSTKKGREFYAKPILDGASKTVRFEIATKGEPPVHTTDRNGARCLFCGTFIKKAPLRELSAAHGVREIPLAIVAEGKGGRLYLPGDSVVLPQVAKPSVPFLEQAITNDRRWFSPPLYGLPNFADLFTPRQLVALTTFSDLVAEARAKVLADALGARASRPPFSIHSRGYLPHWEATEAVQSLTFRLGDSLPKALLESWEQELRQQPPGRRDVERRKRIEKALDAHHGECHLRRPEIAALVEEALLHFDGARYRLHVWTIMPNHVHVVFAPHHGETLSEILHSWKSFTAKEANRLLGRSGTFWQEEYFDRMIRDETHYEAACAYVDENPVKAGLCSKPSEWRFGSAWEGRAALPERAGRPRSQDDTPLADGGLGPQAYADAVATYLAFTVSKCVDYWSTIATWASSASFIRGTFARQALPMTWDFCECNAFSDSTANWSAAIEWVVLSVRELSSLESGLVRQLDATSAITLGARASRPQEGKSNAAETAELLANPIISTDPPYYDNIGYADLSDFFYVWLRRSLKEVYPSLFATALTPKVQELIASPYRHEGSKRRAQDFFETGLGKAFARMHDAHAGEYPLTVYYAFKQSETDDDDDSTDIAPTASTGWETMLEGLIRSGFSITGTWPIRTERSARSVGIGTNALASSIILVCRPRPDNASLATRKEFLTALRRELPEALRNLQRGNIAPVDLAQAAIGPGMAVFTRYAKVIESDGSPMTVRTALGIINQSLDEVLAEQEGEFDGDTRWAVAWFDQYGMDEGPFGDAETLSKAKNTAVNGLVEAGIITARAGKVRLLKRDELPGDWNPAADKRLTVWEITQHLIHRLDQRGEIGAAALVQQLGGMADVSRDLAYRLYSTCERKKWAQEALAYNSLVVAWSELTKLALSSRNRQTEIQKDLFS